MTALRERKPLADVTRMPTRSYVTEWVIGILGVLTAAVGAWMYYVPTDWFLGGLVEGWYLGTFIASGLLFTGAFGLFARKAYVVDQELTMRVSMSTLFAVAALAGAVAFALIWIF